MRTTNRVLVSVGHFLFSVQVSACSVVATGYVGCCVECVATAGQR